MSDWNHTVCDQCWKEKFGDEMTHRVIGAKPVPCCFCGQLTGSGISIRQDPRNTPCEGKHPE